jgi:DNA mismatch repair protein MutS
VKPGPANQSYGLQVAQLAGVPNQVIKRAKSKLVELENQSVSHQSDSGQFEMFSDRTHPVIDRLQELNMDELSPKDALDLLYSLKDDLKK